MSDCFLLEFTMKSAIFLLLLNVYFVFGQNDSDSLTANKTTIETIESGDTVTSMEVPANLTSEAALNDTENSNRTSKLSCNCNNTVELDREAVVQLVNGTTYQTLIYGEHNTSISNRSLPATCSVTLFFAPWCEFSTAGKVNN